MKKIKIPNVSFQEIGKKIVEMIFPRKCGFCNQRIKEDYTCKTCKKKLEYICIKEPILKTKTDFFEICFSAYWYQDIVRKKILEFKFKNKKYLYRSLAERLIEILQSYSMQLDGVVSVPISWPRYLERGYNQADLLARWIAQSLQVPYWRGTLRKKRNTPRQSTLKREERKRNVIDSYLVLKKEKIQGKIILLVDDILTTGATVNECCKVLIKNGAKKIIVATVAKSKIRNPYEKE